MGKVGKQLHLLSQIDAQIFSLLQQRKELEVRAEAFSVELAERKTRLKAIEEAHKEGTLRQVLEEHRLRDEHEKIVDRRRQLSGLGGVKSAKLLAREIDVAGRTVQLLEERALKAIEEVDELEVQIGEMRTDLEKLEAQYESESQETGTSFTQMDKDLQKLQKERSGVEGKLDDQLLRLYHRVKSRYPGDAVAICRDGSCRSCFRSLPPQTYNQVIAGNSLMQCPGCSRILVYSEKVKTK